MKRVLTIILSLLFISVTAQTQHDRRKAQIHAAKMAYISDRLHLTSRQASNFIPVYNDFENEIRDVRRSIFRKYKGTDLANADDETSRQYIDDNLDYQQKVIEIKRKYNDQFLRVISSQQLSELTKAEREFKEMLIKRLDRQNGGRSGRYNGRRGGY